MNPVGCVPRLLHDQGHAMNSTIRWQLARRRDHEIAEALAHLRIEAALYRVIAERADFHEMSVSTRDLETFRAHAIRVAPELRRDIRDFVARAMESR